MIGLVLWLVISRVTPTVPQLVNNKEPVVVIEPGVPCRYYGTAPCCPDLTPTNVTLEFGFTIQPFHSTFAPLSAEVVNIDNICYTLLPLPDGTDTYQQIISTVYKDGYNTIHTSIGTQRGFGVVSSGSPRCTYLDIMFYNIFEDEIMCTTSISYRCLLHGACDQPALGALPVFGVSFKRIPISEECVRLVNDVVLSNGLPSQEYYRFPMRLPSRCVLPESQSGSVIGFVN